MSSAVAFGLEPKPSPVDPIKSFEQNIDELFQVQKESA